MRQSRLTCQISLIGKENDIYITHLGSCLTFIRYKDINPELKVPAFTVGGKHIAESLVLVEYLNDRFPEKK